MIIPKVGVCWVGGVLQDHTFTIAIQVRFSRQPRLLCEHTPHTLVTVHNPLPAYCSAGHSAAIATNRMLSVTVVESH